MLIHIQDGEICQSEMKSLSHFHHSILSQKDNLCVTWCRSVSIFKERETWSLNMNQISWFKLVVEKNIPLSGMVIGNICSRILDLKLKTTTNTDWPTPCACNANEGEDHAKWESRRLHLRSLLKNGNGAGIPLAQSVYRADPNTNRCQINPNWVEWLMGTPLMWTKAERCTC